MKGDENLVFHHLSSPFIICDFVVLGVSVNHWSLKFIDLVLHQTINYCTIGVPCDRVDE